MIGGAAVKLEPLRALTSPLPTKPNTADPFSPEDLITPAEKHEFNKKRPPKGWKLMEMNQDFSSVFLYSTAYQSRKELRGLIALEQEKIDSNNAVSLKNIASVMNSTENFKYHAVWNRLI